MITIRNEQEIKDMKIACDVIKKVHYELKKMIKPGVTGLDLDQAAEKIIINNGCKPNFKGLYDFPNTACVSLNNVLVHGIPNNYKFKNGDVVSVDVGCVYNNMNSDAAFTVIVGTANNEIDEKLVKVTKESLYKAIEVLKPGVRIGDIGHAVQNHIEKAGFHLPTDFAGHGIGTKLHEDPSIPNVGTPGTGLRLKEGMTICIEPMVQIGTKHIDFLEDNWTPVSVNGQNSAHFEHTILITKDGCEVLTEYI